MIPCVGLTILETTIGNSNRDLWKHLKPQSVLEGIRSITIAGAKNKDEFCFFGTIFFFNLNVFVFELEHLRAKKCVYMESYKKHILILCSDFRKQKTFLYLLLPKCENYNNKGYIYNFKTN